jgi:hypothetical protein
VYTFDGIIVIIINRDAYQGSNANQMQNFFSVYCIIDGMSRNFLPVWSLTLFFRKIEIII